MVIGHRPTDLVHCKLNLGDNMKLLCHYNQTVWMDSCCSFLPIQSASQENIAISYDILLSILDDHSTVNLISYVLGQTKLRQVEKSVGRGESRWEGLEEQGRGERS